MLSPVAPETTEPAWPAACDQPSAATVLRSTPTPCTSISTMSPGCIARVVPGVPVTSALPFEEQRAGADAGGCAATGANRRDDNDKPALSTHANLQALGYVCPP